MALAGSLSLKRCVYWILEKYGSGWKLEFEAFEEILEKYGSGWLLEFEEMCILDIGEVWLWLAVGV